MAKRVWHLCMQQFPVIIAVMWLLYTILYEFVHPVPASAVMLSEIVSGFIIIGIFAWRVRPSAMYSHLVAYGGACTLCMWYETYVGFGPHLAAAHWMAAAIGILMLAAFAIRKRKIRNKVPRLQKLRIKNLGEPRRAWIIVAFVWITLGLQPCD